MSLWIRLCNHTYIHTYTAKPGHVLSDAESAPKVCNQYLALVTHRITFRPYQYVWRGQYFIRTRFLLQGNHAACTGQRAGFNHLCP